MARLRRADVVVVRNLKFFTNALKELGYLIAASLRFDAEFLGVLLNFLPVFIEPGKKVNLFAFHAAETHNRVCEHFFVSMPEVRRAVGVVNCCR